MRNSMEIDLDQLALNVESIKQFIPKQSRIMAVIKDNAYGLGSIEIASFLKTQGIHFFAVSTIQEAIELRTHAINDSILILSHTPLALSNLLIKHDLIQTLVSEDYACQLNKFALAHERMIRCHLKIDTGMHRIGYCYDQQHSDIKEILQAYQLTGLNIEGIYTHFASSEQMNKKDIEYTLNQNQLFQDCLKNLEDYHINYGLTHTQSSSAIVNYPQLEYDFVRPGMLMLGYLPPYLSDDEILNQIKPILSLKASIVMIKELNDKDRIGYDLSQIVKNRMKLITVNLGYGDGYPRSLSHQNSHVIICGTPCPIVGNICMDSMMVDGSNLDNVTLDDEVWCIQDQHAWTQLSELAKKAHTIRNELLVSLNIRLPRHYLLGVSHKKSNILKNPK